MSLKSAVPVFSKNTGTNLRKQLNLSLLTDGSKQATRLRLINSVTTKLLTVLKHIICLSSGKNVAPAKIESLFATSPYIEQVFTIGDERAVISTLFVPSLTFFKDKFDKEGIEYDKSQVVIDNSAGAPIVVKVGADFIEKGNIRGLIAEEVARANKELEGFEHIKQYTILTERFTEQNGMLTPTQKTKKKVILETYSEVINKMYIQK